MKNKNLIIALPFLLCAVFFLSRVQAQLEKPGESSEQTMKYEVTDDMIVEKPVPDTLEAREGFHYDVEDDQETDTAVTDIEAQKEEAEGETHEHQEVQEQ